MGSRVRHRGCLRSLSARLCDLGDRTLFDRLVNIADEGFGA